MALLLRNLRVDILQQDPTMGRLGTPMLDSLPPLMASCSKLHVKGNRKNILVWYQEDDAHQCAV